MKTFASACGIGTSVPVTGIAQPTSTEVKRRTRKFCTTFSRMISVYTYDQRILSQFFYHWGYVYSSTASTCGLFVWSAGDVPDLPLIDTELPQNLDL